MPVWLSGCNGAEVNQALCISAGNNSVTLHPSLLFLIEPGGNAANAKLVSRAKQVQRGGGQPHPKERKHNLWKNTGWSLFQTMPFCRIQGLHTRIWSLAWLLVQSEFFILSTVFKGTNSPAQHRESEEAPPARISRAASPAPLFSRQLRSEDSV